ncbi:MAG: TIM barrel protein [Planctomycetota bacterium]|jgi:hydroxypyruvate isomerase|nr:TIM barrel protein [Planctomycetota bacterium]MDP7133045.1 TIM barrel protein [Planctomycetota bacterium]MDP7254245.1 TIM barrel protein [Planctomycetota bacterium]
MSDQEQNSEGLSRRDMIGMAGMVTLGTMAGCVPGSTKSSSTASGKAITKGRIKQSIVHWCFKEHWDLEKACQMGVKLGCKSVELIAPEDWSTLKKYGMACAITPSHLFIRGVNNKNHWDECLTKIDKAIDATADAGFKNVISFTGYGDTTKEENGSIVTPEEGAKNCVDAYKKIIGKAEKKGVNICLEHLNTRDDTHPMKGHPGYQGDHVDYCMDIIKKVGSPNMKLLFDIYHVQIMDGDLVRRIKAYGEYIGHVHTAGNPGRAELDEKQEINYPATMQALLDIGYKGYVGQEFIPVRDPWQGLWQACNLCDV